MTGLAIAAAVALVTSGYRVEEPIVVVALATLNALAERGSVSLSRTTQQSISLLPTLFAAVLFGPLAGGIVGAASMLGDTELSLRGAPERAPRLKWATYTSVRFIIGVSVGLVAELILSALPTASGALFVATLAGAVVGETLDVLSTALTARIRGVRGIGATTKLLLPLVLTSAPVYAPVVAVLAFAYTRVSPWTAPLFFIPALAAQRLYGLYQQQRELSAELLSLNDSLRRANLSFAAALVKSIEAKDEYTAGHSAAVAIYSRDIAERMSLSQDDQDLVYLCGLVHDVGKIGLPASLLDKDGPLTLEERRQMQKHSAIGERILREVDTYSAIAAIVRHHHERVDGEGYPDGLTDTEIPLLSRIIAVADAYNAMTSNRPYRDAMPSRVARLRLAQAVETQFDTAVVAAFEAILAAATEDYRMARQDQFRVFSSDSAGDASGPRLALDVA